MRMIMALSAEPLFRRILLSFSWRVGAIRRLSRQIGADRAGVTAIEFAVVAPIFLLMIAGVVEVGRAYWINNTLQFAVEETTRQAIVVVDPSTITGGALSEADRSNLEAYFATRLSGLSGVTPTFAVDTAGTATFLTVSTSYPFQTLIPLVEIPPVTLTARSRIPLSG